MLASLTNVRCGEVYCSHKLLTEVGLGYTFWFGVAHCSASKFSNARDGLVVLSLLHKPLCFRLLWTALWAVVLINIQSLLYTGKPAQQNHHM